MRRREGHDQRDVTGGANQLKVTCGQGHPRLPGGGRHPRDQGAGPGRSVRVQVLSCANPIGTVF